MPSPRRRIKKRSHPMLEKTTELSGVDRTADRDTFHHLIFDELLVLFVVLGGDAESAALVARADKVAGGPDDLRRVVWMRKPANHEDQLKALKSSDLLAGGDVAAFTTNFDDVVCDVIHKSELPVGFVRIMEAFAKGEA
jgi:hypothetical protein